MKNKKKKLSRGIKILIIVDLVLVSLVLSIPYLQELDTKNTRTKMMFGELAEKPETHSWAIGHESTDVMYADDDLSLTLKGDTLSSTGAVFILQNNSQEEMTYGVDYRIQINIKDRWYEIEKYMDWVAVGMLLAPDESTEIPANWSEYYGKLPKGTYRFVKDFLWGDKDICLGYEFVVK